MSSSRQNARGHSPSRRGSTASIGGDNGSSGHHDRRSSIANGRDRGSISSRRGSSINIINITTAANTTSSSSSNNSKIATSGSPLTSSPLTSSPLTCSALAATSTPKPSKSSSSSLPKSKDPLRGTRLGGGGGITTRRAAKSPSFRNKLRQMALPLAPLVQMTTGAVHPAFPGTLLGFWLLTEGQLDDLAHFYHQRTPGPWTVQYPRPITWSGGLSMEEKRRKIGKFIGLRGCNTPTIAPENGDAAAAAQSSSLILPSSPPVCLRCWIKTEEQILEEARQAHVADDDDEALRKKAFWYR